MRALQYKTINLKKNHKVVACCISAEQNDKFLTQDFCLVMIICINKSKIAYILGIELQRSRTLFS